MGKRGMRKKEKVREKDIRKEKKPLNSLAAEKTAYLTKEPRKHNSRYVEKHLSI